MHVTYNSVITYCMYSTFMRCISLDSLIFFEFSGLHLRLNMTSSYLLETAQDRIEIEGHLC